jgi:hypothetical protein
MNSSAKRRRILSFVAILGLFSFLRSRRTILFGLLAAGSVAAYFLVPVPGGITAFHQAGSEGTAMTGRMGNGTAPRSAAIPSIDASLPGVTETATFALG